MLFGLYVSASILAVLTSIAGRFGENDGCPEDGVAMTEGSATNGHVAGDKDASLTRLLVAADLSGYEREMRKKLKLRNAGDLQYVEELDLSSIGMSRPEQKRLRKEYTKMYPSGFVGKLKKVFGRSESCDRKEAVAQREDDDQHVIPLEKITLCKELGHGEFGSVWQASWKNNAEVIQVAVKCVAADKLLSSSSSFLQEAAIMTRMRHDHVVRLFGVVLDTKKIMMVSELATCGSLLECIHKPALRDSFPVHVLCDYAEQMAMGMAYLESQRLIHRDLAARNVLVFSPKKSKMEKSLLKHGIIEELSSARVTAHNRCPISLGETARCFTMLEQYGAQLVHGQWARRRTDVGSWIRIRSWNGGQLLWDGEIAEEGMSEARVESGHGTAASCCRAVRSPKRACRKLEYRPERVCISWSTNRPSYSGLIFSVIYSYLQQFLLPASHVKISDFGLSRSLGVGEDYYRSEFTPSLRLPIAWCAPECINFLKFTSKSDVWAYGVTLWEMFTYGQMPWQGRSGAQILEAVDRRRELLERPSACPEDIYELMKETWTHAPERRPTFAEIVEKFPERRVQTVRAISDCFDNAADHLNFKKDDLIVVIDRFPAEYPDGYYWFGSLRNGKLGLFRPSDTVAHLGSEAPANNGTTLNSDMSFSEKKKDSEKKNQKKDKENERERRKALISEPVGEVRHTCHVGIDGTAFGLLQLDKKDLTPSAVSPSASHTPRQMSSQPSPAPSHASSSSSVQFRDVPSRKAIVKETMSLRDTSSLSKDALNLREAVSPPQYRAPSQPPTSSTLLHATSSLRSNHNFPLIDDICEQFASLERDRSRGTITPSAPPLTASAANSLKTNLQGLSIALNKQDDAEEERWLATASTMSSRTSTHSPSFNGGVRREPVPPPRGPVAAVYARGKDIPTTAHASEDKEDANLREEIQRLDRDITNFSLSTLGDFSDTRPLMDSFNRRDADLEAKSARSQPEPKVRFMTDQELKKMEDKRLKEHRKAEEALKLERRRETNEREVLDNGVDEDSTSLSAGLLARRSQTSTDGPDGWSPEAQEAYKLLVECGTSLKHTATPSPPLPSSSSSRFNTLEKKRISGVDQRASVSPAPPPRPVTPPHVAERERSQIRVLETSEKKEDGMEENVESYTPQKRVHIIETKLIDGPARGMSPPQGPCPAFTTPMAPPRNSFEAKPPPGRPPKTRQFPIVIDERNLAYDNLNGFGAGAKKICHRLYLRNRKSVLPKFPFHLQKKHPTEASPLLGAAFLKTGERRNHQEERPRHAAVCSSQPHPKIGVSPGFALVDNSREPGCLKGCSRTEPSRMPFTARQKLQNVVRFHMTSRFTWALFGAVIIIFVLVSKASNKVIPQQEIIKATTLQQMPDEKNSADMEGHGEQPANENKRNTGEDSMMATLLERIKLMEEEIASLRSRVSDSEDRAAVPANFAVPTTKTYPSVKYRNEETRKRILVTGGAGFVGSHLVDKLMSDGHEVIALDNYFTGRKRNIDHWIGHPNFEMVHHDVVNPYFVEVDQIYHLASPASPPHYMYNPVKTIKTNTLGTINMLGLAKRVKATVLLASTSEVYGDPEEHPQPETYWGHVNTIGPRSCYDEGKRVAESLMVSYNKQEKVPIRIARIFNTFGPRMHMNDGRVVSNFIIQALQDKPMTIYGDGKQTRSFQYVSDLVDGLVALMNSNYSLPVNIGNPEEHTIAEFATIIRDLVSGSKSEILNMASQEDDPKQRRPDITRAAKEISWHPKVTMKNGLLRTIEYFRDELETNKRGGKPLPQAVFQTGFESR
ncbi:unnamed protein product [Caenorhabditis auriculariae]|uniref:UDP-glucuronate decarboxylase n=1 Tax=Caenorhabditis auriculariae TaxID=2777116 RepID=A0A8S1I014_9PELO|nr:unnamed protein product [Caenorhabditis auriculariae]